MCSWFGWLVLIALAIFGIRFIVKAIAFALIASVLSTYI